MESLGINSSYLLLQIGCVIAPTVVVIGVVVLLIRSRNQAKK